MKRAVLFIALAISVMFLVSCYWISGLNSASVRLDLSGLADKGIGDRYARIWLVSNDKIFPLGEDKDYIQKLIPGWEEVTVTLEDVPAGITYRVWVSVVIQEVDGFSTYVWAESAEFPLSPGDEAAVAFTTEKLYESQGMIFSPVIDTDADLTKLAGGLKDVEVYSGNVYVTDGSKLYEITSFNTTPGVVSLDAPANQAINSVSRGAVDYMMTALVLDTNTDIVPYNGDLGYNPPITTNLSPVSVLDSASGDYSGGKVLLFRKAEGWGGTYVDVNASDPAAWKWLNRSSGKVYDLVMSQNFSGFSYFANETGAFRFSGDYLSTLFFGGSPNLDDYTVGFQAPEPILSLGLINPDGEILLMGTEDGVYSAWPTGEPDVIGTPSIENGTEGYRINKIATNYYYPNYAAYLSDAYLFVWDPDSEILHKFPLCAGLPGRITGMVWYAPGSGSYYLLVSGDEGLVYIEFGQQPV